MDELRCYILAKQKINNSNTNNTLPTSINNNTNQLSEFSSITDESVWNKGG
jgi:hypothetical protein